MVIHLVPFQGAKQCFTSDFGNCRGRLAPFQDSGWGTTFFKMFLVYRKKRCFLLVRGTLSPFLLLLRMLGAFLVPFRFALPLLTVLAGTRKKIARNW